MQTTPVKILVLAVKGGTGKSTGTAGLGTALSARGVWVGLMDLDILGANPDQHGYPEAQPGLDIWLVFAEGTAPSYPCTIDNFVE